jgi:hypothetical protein
MGEDSQTLTREVQEQVKKKAKKQSAQKLFRVG